VSEPLPQDALEALGACVTPPDAAVGREVRHRLAGARHDAGRLVDMAAWWAEVSGEPQPPAPRSAHHVALGGTTGDERSTLLEPPLRTPVTRSSEQPPADVDAAIGWGAHAADALADAGNDVVLLSAADDLDARVLAACLMGQDVVEALGWPHEAGVDDATWMRLAVDLRDGLRRVRGRRAEPERLLRALGSATLAAGTAVVLQSAARRTPVLLDGYGSLVCAVLAVRVARPVQGWLLVPHAADNARVTRALRSLSLTPFLCLRIEAEDGSAALLGLGLLETACGLLGHAMTQA
jgi:hypothetical protein